jgi:7-cyano-7-deazaguanine synthase in queuosine biosynthesis
MEIVMAEKVVLALSGGLDSYTLMVYLLYRGYHVYPVFVFYNKKGQPEFEYAQRQVRLWKEFSNGRLEDLKVVRKILCDKDMVKSPFVKGRNKSILNILIEYAKENNIKSVAMALVPHYQFYGKEARVVLYTYEDANYDWYLKMKKKCKEMGIVFLAPFVRKPKKFVINLAKKYKEQTGIYRYEDSFSCFNHKSTMPCMDCLGCWDSEFDAEA